MKTCSLSCVKQHKLTSGCDGQRDTTAFVSLDDFTDLNLLSGSFEQFLCILFHCHVIQYSLTLAFSWKGIESQAASKLLLAGCLLHTKVVLFLNFVYVAIAPILACDWLVSYNADYRFLEDVERHTSQATAERDSMKRGYQHRQQVGFCLSDCFCVCMFVFFCVCLSVYCI